MNTPLLHNAALTLTPRWGVGGFWGNRNVGSNVSSLPLPVDIVETMASGLAFDILRELEFCVARGELAFGMHAHRSRDTNKSALVVIMNYN
jgi:hypothetical protein